MLQSAKPALQEPMRQLIGTPPQKTEALGTGQHCEPELHAAPIPVGTHPHTPEGLQAPLQQSASPVQAALSGRQQVPEAELHMPEQHW